MISRSSVLGAFPTKPLGEIVEFLDSMRRPVTESERRAGPYPYYGANGQQGTIDDFIFDEPLVLLAEDGGHFDDPSRGIAYRVSGRTWVNNHAHVLRPNGELDLGFLCRVLENYDVTPWVTGTTRGKLTQAGAAQIIVPLPPLPEQRRIAEILDKADALRAKRRAALGQLDTLTQSIFLDIFGDPATNPKGWPIGLMEDVAEIVSGATPRTDKPEFWDGTIMWVTPKELSDLQGIYITEAERRITEAGLQSCAATVLPTGAVLFSSRAPIGHTAICAAPMATNQGFKSFIPRPDRLDAHYLLQWLRQRRSFLEGLGTGATFKEVSKAVVARIEIPLPPLALQASFADRLRRIQDLGAEGRKARALLDEQFAVLQHRAFRGDL